MYKVTTFIALLGLNTFLAVAHPPIDIRDDTAAVADVSQQTIFCTKAVMAWPAKDKPSQNSQNGCTYTTVNHPGMCTAYKPIIGTRMRAIKPAADQYCVAYTNSNCSPRGHLIGPAGNMDLGDNISSYRCDALSNFLMNGDLDNNDGSVFAGTNGAIPIKATKRQQLYDVAPTLETVDSVELKKTSIDKRDCPTVKWCAYPIPGRKSDDCGSHCVENRKCVNPSASFNDKIHSWSHPAPYVCYLYQHINCQGDYILMDAAGNKVARDNEVYADLAKFNFDHEISSYYCTKGTSCPPEIHDNKVACV